MSEYKRQKKVKPEIEAFIAQITDPVLRGTMSAFVQTLREKKMKPSWYATNKFHVKYKGKVLLRIYMDREGHAVVLYLYTVQASQVDRLLKGQDESVRRFFFDHIRYCRCLSNPDSCASACAPGVDVDVFGQSLEHVCFCSYHCEFYICINDPTEEEIAGVWTMLELRKAYIQNGLSV